MKKPVISLVTTWIIRLLIVAMVLSAVCLFMLSTIAGTGETQRRGLEQALSDSMNARVTLGKLEQFNIMPQLSIVGENMDGVYNDTQNHFKIDRLEIAFGFADLMMGKKKIENLQLKNYRFSDNSKYAFRIDEAGIIDVPKPGFTAQGIYDGEKFRFFMSLTQEDGTRKKYYLEKENDIAGRYGTLDITGKFVLGRGAKTEMFQDIHFSVATKDIAFGKGIKNQAGEYVIQVNCPSIPPETAVADLKKLSQLTYFDIEDACLR